MGGGGGQKASPWVVGRAVFAGSIAAYSKLFAKGAAMGGGALAAGGAASKAKLAGAAAAAAAAAGVAASQDQPGDQPAEPPKPKRALAPAATRAP
mmetsp:Transcript_29601/g.96413  ORF Transcript_29601/g.96413 Transcript_29601/m.96413 type:complete len:95 (-) Transcript_29601:49-333(-)